MAVTTTYDFYPRPPRGGRPETIKNAGFEIYFYPRPPRGGRPEYALRAKGKVAISIHALREEGDDVFVVWFSKTLQFLSTPSARRATLKSDKVTYANTDFYPRPPRGGRLAEQMGVTRKSLISIHALREEGDTPRAFSAALASDFYPRPPRGGRRYARHLDGHDQHFYPRPPRGGRQQKQRENTLLLSHYTPLCTNCKEMLANQTAKSHRYLRKRLVFRCEASRKTMCAADSHWPDIKRSARCLGQILGAVQRARPWSGSCCPAGRTADCPRQGRSGRSALL